MRKEISSYAIELLNSLLESINKYKLGSDVEYSYIREKLDKLNTLVEQEIK